jgi:oligoribonuclease NrnB/cAMP/cGMP phosphodiesterase (DHH superfamily)
MNPLVIYHANCADGFAAAWVFWSHHGSGGVDLHPAKYGAPPPDLRGRPAVALVDFCYPPEVLLPLIENGQTVTVLDHHIGAASAWEALMVARGAERVEDAEGALLSLEGTMRTPAGGRLHLHFDMNRSGATMAWDFLHPNVARPALLGHIEDRDLWRFKLPNTEAIQAAVFSYPYDFEVWDKLMASDKAALTKLAASGQALARAQAKNVAELAVAGYRLLWLAGRQVPVVNVPYMMASDMGHLLAKQHRALRTRDVPEEQHARVAAEVFAATYYDDATHRCFSLRSLEDGADVCAIAKSYGGGGHRHAAGFKVPRDHALARA